MLGIVKADGRKIPLADRSVQCVVTSLPYWGLRKYAGEQELVWGGREDCEHEWAESIRQAAGNRYSETSTLGHGCDGSYRLGKNGSQYLKRLERATTPSPIGACSKCGAWRGAYGLEPTVELYVQHTVEILREIRRVLRDDGVCFLNIGDSYVGGGGFSKGAPTTKTSKSGKYGLTGALKSGGVPVGNGLKPKDLCLIPFRVALAAQSDGWWVRSDIIWAKPNPMPESVTDRPTRSHEYVFLLTKSANYYWDADAVKEPAAWERWGAYTQNKRESAMGWAPNRTKEEIQALGNGNRNIRSVWTFATEPYPEAHFATFPEELPRRCILAATSSKGACARCGSPWERVVKKKASTMNIRVRDAKKGTLESKTGFDQREKATEEEVDEYAKEELGYTETIGWRPGCECGTKRTVPSIVLDPFAGSRTVGKVAIELGRRAILCDLAYQDLASKRTAAIQRPLLTPDSAGWRE